MFVSNDIKKVINRHKNWNEKYEVFTFTVSYEKEEYYYILFKIFINKINGAMVINKKGNLPNRNTAIEVIKKLNFYNDSILYTANELNKIKERPIGVLPHTIEMLESELSSLHLNHDLASEFKEFKIMYKEMDEGQARLKEI